MVAMARIDNDDIHTAFMEGQEARHSGLKSRDNPYAKDNPALSQAWSNGWNVADEEMTYGADNRRVEWDVQ